MCVHAVLYQKFAFVLPAYTQSVILAVCVAASRNSILKDKSLQQGIGFAFLLQFWYTLARDFIPCYTGTHTNSINKEKA